LKNCRYPQQHQLWNIFESLFIPELQKYAKGYRLILALGGDLVDGVMERSKFHWGTRKEQRDDCISLLQGIVSQADALITLKGTEAHAGENGEEDQTVAEALGAQVCDWREMIPIGDRSVDWTHHGINVSQSGWTEENGMLSVARRVEYEALRRGLKKPDVIISHHAHHSPEPIYLKGMWVGVCPCWQLVTPYSAKVASRTNPDIGALFYDPQDNTLKRVTYAIEKDPFTIRWNKRYNRRS